MEKKESKQNKTYQKLVEIWAGILPFGTELWNPEPVRVRIEATQDFIDQELDKAREETISSFVDFLSTKGEYISANDVDEFLVSKLKQ